VIGAVRPNADDYANYGYVADTRAAKGELRPRHLTLDVYSLYREYSTRVNLDDAPELHPFTIDDRAALTGNAECLSHVRFGPLRSEVLKSAPTGKCAYCFQLKASEVDHYLPKEIFGEYSVYAPNLVPSCSKCNRIKSKRYKRENGGRRYVHPYLDPFPHGTSVHLAGTVDMEVSVSVRFTLVKPTEVPESLWLIVQQQFKDLKLLERYSDEAAEEMASMLSAYYAHYDRGGAQELHRQLAIQRDSKRNLYGFNHWWPVLLEALCASVEFCDGGFRNLGSDPGLLAY